MFRLFECCALSFFERFVLSFSLKIERFVSDSAEIWICGLYCATTEFDAAKIHSSVFKAPYSLGEGLARTLEFEFIYPPTDDITFKSE